RCGGDPVAATGRNAPARWPLARQPGRAERVAERDGHRPATLACGPAGHPGAVWAEGGRARSAGGVGWGLSPRPAPPGPPELPRLATSPPARYAPELSGPEYARPHLGSVEPCSPVVRFDADVELRGPDVDGPRQPADGLIASAHGDRRRRSSSPAAELQH